MRNTGSVFCAREDGVAGTQGGSERVALITGANRGIGREIARQLGKQGIVVLVGARDNNGGRTATEALRVEGINAREILLDVRKQSTIDAAAAAIGREFGRLDILVNNAAILLERVPPSEGGVENLRQTLETNVVGLFAVTRAFLPLLRKSTAGRIVNLSSGLGSLTLMADVRQERYPNHTLAYAASKAAVNAITIAFAKELRGTPIKVNAVSPGYTATAMNNFSGPKTVEQGAALPVQMATLAADGPTGAFLEAEGPIPW
jgi:NAD(P)-dependent dehydrogenase (short-subunit alcohol dehydrogenase family)